MHKRPQLQHRYALFIVRESAENRVGRPPSLTITIPYSSNLPQGSGSQGPFFSYGTCRPKYHFFPEFDYYFFQKIWFMDHEDAGFIITLASKPCWPAKYENRSKHNNNL